MIEVPYRITRAYVQQHPELFFVYGIDKAEQGTFGQCWDLHGEPNTGPVYTCWKMCKNNRYFSDTQLEEIKQINVLATSAILKKAMDNPIVVLPKIGRGGSRMFEFAPKAYEWLMKRLDIIQSKDVKIKY